MKQQKIANFENNNKKHPQFDQTKERAQSLLDLQQEQMVEQSHIDDNYFALSQNIHRRSSMQGPTIQAFTDALSMEKFNLFLQSSHLGNPQPKPQNKRPKTLIDSVRPNKKNVNNDSSKKQILKFHSSPSYTLRGQTQEETQINIRTFQSKFIRELNFRDNQRLRKTRKRLQLNKNSEMNGSQMQQKLKRTAKPHLKKQMHEIWFNGIRVLSQFKNEIIHGQTQIFYPNGAKFFGRYEQGVRVFGDFDFNNGYSYSGGFWGDKFQGQGQLTLPNNKVFSGDWYDNQLSGKVEIRYPSGDVYYGQIKEFKKHGKGYLFFKNGQKFVGEFQNGSISGKGQYFINEQCIGRGYWKNGELIQKVQDDEQFQFFDSPVSKRSIVQQSSSCEKMNKLSTKSLQQKYQQQEEYQQDFITFDDIDQEEQFHIQVRSNRNMISFNQIDVNRQKIDKRLKERDIKKKVSFRSILVTICKIVDEVSKNQQNFEEKNVSGKVRSSRRLRTQKLKKPQYKSRQGSQTCDDEFLSTGQMVETFKNVQKNNFDNKKLLTQDLVKTSKNGYLDTISHSQSSQTALMKTGQFNSVGSLKKTESGSESII